MWLFTKNHGHLSIGQHASDHDVLVINAQLREDIDKFVAVLDAVGSQKHQVQDTAEGDYPFAVLAKRSVVAQAIAQLVAAIDYSKFIHSFHVDFGSSQAGYLLWMRPNGLQVARVQE